MKNVFLIGNGFDLHHKLPTKYFDFLCVAEYLTRNMIAAPLYVGKVFLQCKKSGNIQECYQSHKEAFDSTEVPFDKVSEIINLLQENMWFKYFLKTLDVDAGWIDFEKEISTVISVLDYNIDDKEIHLPKDKELPPFVLSYFKYFVDVGSNVKLYPGNSYNINKAYLNEYPHNSGIYIANKKKIFEELFSELINFSKALRLYLKYFVESAFDFMCDDPTIKEQKLSVLIMADNVVTFNYTNTIERFYANKSTFHIHGSVNSSNIVLGINPDESDECGVSDTTPIKFEKYYQREAFGTLAEYIKWYRETIGSNTEYRVITIGHSLDETDRDILSDMFLNAKEIFVTYYDESCRDDYFRNINKMFTKDGYNKFVKEQGLQFVLLSEIDKIKEIIKPPMYEFYRSNMNEDVNII